MTINPVFGATNAPAAYPIPDDQNGTAAIQPSSPGVASQAPVAATSETKSAPASKEAVQDAVKKLNDFVSKQTSDVQFSIDDATHIRVVKVVDSATNEVIRQIPSQEVLQFARTLDHLQGLIVREKA